MVVELSLLSLIGMLALAALSGASSVVFFAALFVGSRREKTAPPSEATS